MYASLLKMPNKIEEKVLVQCDILICMINTLKSTSGKSPTLSPFPLLPCPFLVLGAGTSKQIKKIISMAHETMRDERDREKAANKKQITALSVQLNGTLGKQCCQPGCRKNKKCVHT